MGTLHAIAGNGPGARQRGAAAANEPAAHESVHAESSAKPAAKPAAKANADAGGVQVSFSHESLKALEDTAIGIAGAARDAVHAVGEAGAALVTDAAGKVVNEVADRVSTTVESAVGYAALAGLAVAGLVNELA